MPTVALISIILLVLTLNKQGIDALANATVHDSFSIAPVGPLSVDGSGNVFFNGIRFATITTDNTLDGAGNVLTYAITFEPSGVTNAQMDPLIQAIRFTNSSDTPPTTQRTITYTVADTEGDQSHNTLALRIETTRAPELTDLTPSLTVSGPDASAGVLLDDSINIINPDYTGFNSGSLVLELANATADDNFSIAPAGPLSVDGSGNVFFNGVRFAAITTDNVLDGASNVLTYAITFEPSGVTNAQVDPLIQAIRFTNSSDTPPTTQRTITYTIADTEGDRSHNTLALRIETTRAPELTDLTPSLTVSGPDANVGDQPETCREADKVWSNCFGTRPLGNQGDTFEGMWLKGKPHGEGSLTRANGASYLGEWRNGKRHGQGSFTAANGDSYVGNWKDGKRDGKGTFVAANGATYTGDWHNDQKHGSGTLIFADGRSFAGRFINDKPDKDSGYMWEGGSASGDDYKGELKDGKRQGKGVFTDAKGNTYMGSWKDGKRHGTGTFAGVDGTTYTGKWENDKKHGMGTLTFPDGKSFIGRFRNDKPDRESEHVWDNGARTGATYIGETKNGKRHGEGVFTDAKGNTYIGDWENGKRSGTGSFVWGDGANKGRYYVGKWQDDRMHGQGTLTMEDGSSYMGEWKDGKRHGRGTVTGANGKSFVGEREDNKLIKTFPKMQ